MRIDHRRARARERVAPRACARPQAVGKTSAGAGRDRRAGRTTTIVLAALAAVCVAGLAFGVSRVLAPASGPAQAQASASQAPSAAARAQPGPAARARTSAAPVTESGTRPSMRTESREARPARTPGSRGRELAARLAEKKAAQRAASGEWAPARRVDPGATGASGGGAPPAPRGFATPMAGTDPAAESTGPTGSPYAPGYVEVFGVTMRTPGQRAGMQRGDRILEYNGQPVASRLELEAAWSDPSLPATVPILVERRTGGVETRDVPRGDLGLILPPRYNP